MTPRRLTREPTAKGRRQGGSGRGDGDGVALREAMVMGRLSATGWRRRGARTEDDGGNFSYPRELSAGAARYLLRLTGRVVGPHNVQTR